MATGWHRPRVCDQFNPLKTQRALLPSVPHWTLQRRDGEIFGFHFCVLRVGI